MSDKRIEIMDLAEKLIRTKGYNAFSYKDISVPLQIKNAAVHYHFPKKSDLGEEIILKTRNAFKKKYIEWEQCLPKEKLKNFIALYEKNQSLNLVCLVGALGSSYESLPENMQISLTKMSEEIRGWMQDVLNEGLKKKEFNFTETADEKTDVVIAALLSSLILDKVIQKNILKSVKASILKSI